MIKVFLIILLCIILTVTLYLKAKDQKDEENNRTGKLSVAEAREKLAALQNEWQEIKSCLLIEKKIALGKFELQQKPLKDKILKPLPPKNEFETTTQYETRIKQHQEKIEPLKRKYEAHYDAIVKKYDGQLQHQYTKYKNRVETILNQTYPAQGLKIIPTDYNADEQIYRLKLIEENGRVWEYQLSIEPGKAKIFFQRRDTLKVQGYYANIDALFLIEVKLIDPILGELTPTFTRLRSKCDVLSYENVIKMLQRKNFFDRSDNQSGEFRNLLELKTLRGHPVVIDRATGLMWHRSGSLEPMPFAETEPWLKELNSSGYAGYHDWRLPTSEEAASLLEKNQQNLLYIDPLFSSKQANIWTCDKTKTGRVWGVSFSVGNLADYRNPVQGFYLRPVRSGRVKGKLHFP